MQVTIHGAIYSKVIVINNSSTQTRLEKQSNVIQRFKWKIRGFIDLNSFMYVVRAWNILDLRRLRDMRHVVSAFLYSSPCNRYHLIHTFDFRLL